MTTIDSKQVSISRFAGGYAARRTTALVLVLCLALISTGCASMTRSQKAATACMAADLATTAWGMAQGHSENNPTVSSLDDWQIMVANAAIHWGLNRLMKKAPSQKAAAFWSSYAAIRCGAALHNYGIVSSGGEAEVAPSQ